jgi:hypothetical protein
MIKRSPDSGDAQAGLRSSYWDRPPRVQVAEFAILISAALLLLGGAYGEQADLTRAGLLFLALGVVLVPGAFRRSWGMKVAFFALAAIGLFYALTT